MKILETLDEYDHMDQASKDTLWHVGRKFHTVSLFHDEIVRAKDNATHGAMMISILSVFLFTYLFSGITFPLNGVYIMMAFWLELGILFALFNAIARYKKTDRIDGLKYVVDDFHKQYHERLYNSLTNYSFAQVLRFFEESHALPLKALLKNLKCKECKEQLDLMFP